jgi:DNA topoisomerase-1
LLPVRDQLDPKYHFLLDGPVKDPQGNPVQVRFSRKMRRQYLMSEADGKPTAWRAFHRDGKWVVSKDE